MIVFVRSVEIASHIPTLITAGRRVSQKSLISAATSIHLQKIINNDYSFSL